MIVRLFSFAVISCLLISASPLLAQSQENLKAAGEYVNLPGVQRMFDEMFSPSAMAANVTNNLPAGTELTADQTKRIGLALSGELGQIRPALETAMVKVTASHFTLAEIQALSAFYQSTEGASVMAKMQPYMQDFMTLIAPDLQDAQKSALPEIIKIMSEK